jgi:bis(5'-nucleosyl)-tetraphosphatase (symmetrical)
VNSSQALYAIGDVQGCLASLLQLLRQIPAEARLVFVGDLVNRGPESLATLRAVRRLGERATCILGNHDLHLLAVAAGIRAPGRNDTLDEILAAPDRDELLTWLRHRPLAHREGGALFVHAGLMPSWSAERALALAAEVEAGLRGPGWREFLAPMYGNTPTRWDDALTGPERLRGIVNGLTRLRYLKPDGSMDFDIKEGAAAAPAGYRPWFEAPDRAAADELIVFAHWSTLGLVLREKLIAIDTGCVWGGQLTAVRISDRAVLQVDCPQAQRPG